MANLTLQFGEEEYRIVSSSGEEGDLSPYGEPALLEENGVSYMALFDKTEDGEGQDSPFPEGCSIIEYKAVSGVVEEDVDFTDTGGDSGIVVVDEDK
jgi:hypothetical protein